MNNISEFLSTCDLKYPIRDYILIYISRRPETFLSVYWYLCNPTTFLMKKCNQIKHNIFFIKFHSVDLSIS